MFLALLWHTCVGIIESLPICYSRVCNQEMILVHCHIPVVISVIISDRFGVVRVMFGIPKRVSSLFSCLVSCLRGHC